MPVRGFRIAALVALFVYCSVWFGAASDGALELTMKYDGSVLCTNGHVNSVPTASQPIVLRPGLN